MSIGSKPATSYSITDESNINQSSSTTDCEKDLGIWITYKLLPSTQCQKAYSRAMQSETHL